MTDAQAALKAEIARLSGAINLHKSKDVPQPSSSAPSTFRRSNTYVNPNYKPPKPVHRPVKITKPIPTPGPSRPLPPAKVTREVVIDGLAFESSGRSLVRKDLPIPAPRPQSSNSKPPSFQRTHPGSRGTQRPYKPKTSRARHQNMTLASSRKTYQSVLSSMFRDNIPALIASSRGRKTKSIKYSDKQCSRFATTGVCQRGLTCPYQHDPSKIAICWPFLQGNCPNNAATCALSHEPTPERTPLCVHFANNGRCKNGETCLYPHVNVGQRSGVCRDFAVLGYCEKGLDCDKQHVRECPDFAENGKCLNSKCKLPHVIRANRNRKPPPATGTKLESSDKTSSAHSSSSPDTNLTSQSTRDPTDASIGDEYISLTFHETDSDSEDDGDEEDSEKENSEEERSEASVELRVSAGQSEDGSETLT
ncbi:hypothetical protein BD410DRAFT_897239 [Rickenella mellea]|uniref:C3H1-type domain-containing protein n=1 Tax=Rickenella mellea TaxID=50990 RepID=A0A4Y7Q7G4_9AGAM|nr:hypothetical protein BD410DRAFT_897239 [Rickenella mellea]